MSDLSIPDFLRSPINQGEAMTIEKKKRKITELLTVIKNAKDEPVTISDLSLTELANYQAGLHQMLANVPYIQLELRSINAEIRKRAK